MLKLVSVIGLLCLGIDTFGQKLDSIYFNLYTDSLKRGTYNYINVEGKFDNGTYLPLGEKELKFTASEGKFSGNSLFVDSSIKSDKIKVKVMLKSNPGMWRETDIYIKKYESNEKLPTMEEALQNRPADRSNRKKRRKK